MCSSEALAQAREFRIPAQDAKAALAEFGRQSGRELLFDYEGVQGHLTHELIGLFEPAEAIRLLLLDTGLRVTIGDDGVFVIDAEGASTGSTAVLADTGPGRGSADERAGTGSEQRRTRATGQQSPRAAHGSSPDGPGEERGALGEVVVTGSRIPQQVLSTPMPLLVLDREAIEITGQDNLADIVMGLPSVGVGVSLATSRQSLSFGAGRSLANLRRLGVERTLVLVNGRRQVSGAPLSAAVDLNTIPAPLVERTEIVTSGTSAIYGADAVSGVINVLLRKDFEGLQLRARTGVTTRGDGESHGLSITAGSNFDFGGNGGNVTLSFLSDDVNGVDALDRRYGANGLDTISNPANEAPNDGIPNFIHRANIRFNGFSDAGHFSVRGQTWIFSDDGQAMRPFDFGEVGNRSGRSIGGDGGFFERFDPLTLPIQRQVFAGTLHYAVVPGVDFFFEGRLSNTDVQQAWQPTLDPLGIGNITLGIGNPFLPASTVALMLGDPADPSDDISSIALHRIVNELGRRATDNDRQMRQYVAGVDGRLRNDWTFELSYANGQTTDTTRQLNDRHTARYLQSLDAIRDPVTGEIVCRDPSNGCAPLNLIGRNQASPAAIAFSRIDSSFFQRARQQVAAANLTGDLLDLWAGPLQFSSGAEYREEDALSQPSALQELGQSFLPRVARTAGKFHVIEGYLELRSRLMRDLPFASDLSVSAAVRESRYSTSGRETAWHTGVEFEPVEDLRLRGVLSRSVRAPNLGELFSPANEGFFFGQDPCDASANSVSATRLENCLALGIPADYQAPTNGLTLKALFGGDPNLVPESGETWTAGFVFRPRFLPRLTLVADYWRTEIGDSINAIAPQIIVDSCVDLPISVEVNPNCRLVRRDPATLEILSINATEANIGRIAASGIDAELNYVFDVEGFLEGKRGSVGVNVIGTYLQDLNFFSDAGDPRTLDTEEGETGDPRFQAIGTLTYKSGPLSLSWRTSYVGDARTVSFPGMPSDQFDLPRTGTKLFHDLSVGYRLADHASLRVNVNNIFDERPPQRGFLFHSGIGTDAAIYPNLGTTLAGSVSYSF